ncbi:MAG TPA: hypothetical protein VM345_04755 [Acidimicrobiales bacterium]|nr:hypothetical protein [Acidimicrobiales bacterium]
MPEGGSGAANTPVKISLDGAHLRVDARPARLVSMLKGADGTPLVTAQPSAGAATSEPLPAAARQATFRVRDDVTVEATSAANFVAIADEKGPCVVIAYGGELTVIPGGNDRFALGAHEALLVGVDGGPTVIPAAELTEESHPELASLLDDAAEAVLAPAAATAATAEDPGKAEGTPTSATEAAGAGDDETAPATAAAVAAVAATTPAAKKAAATPAKAASKSTGGQRRKKGKKGRPQPSKSAAKKAAPVGAGADAAAAGAAGAAAATKAAKAGGAGKQPPKDPPKGGGGGGGGGGGHDDDSYEDTPRDKRFIVGTVLVALVLAVGAVLLLSNVGGDDDGVDVATGTTTTEVEEPTTSSTALEATTTEAPATTAPRATTTTAPATTTTARATTTTAAPTTTAPAPNYSIEPKSCVQNGNSITYTAAVTNSASGPWDFTIDISFKTADGGEVAKATANVTRLASGRTADFSATGTSSRNLAGTGASCDVTRVDARPSR